MLFFVVFTMRVLVIYLGMQDLSAKSFLPFISMSGILCIPYFNKLGYYKYNSFTFTLIAPALMVFFSASSQRANEIVNINHYYFPRIMLMGLLVLPLVLIETKDKKLMYIAIGVNFLCQLLFDTAVDVLGVPFDPAKADFNGLATIRVLILLPALFATMAFIFLRNLNEQYETQIVRLNKSLTKQNKNLEQFNEEIKTQRDLIVSKNEALEQSNEEVKVQRDTIAEKNELLEDISSKIEQVHKDLTDSILYAKTIQRAVLLEQQLPQGYFQDSFIYLKAKSHVSGDFYYYKTIQIDGQRAIAVAAVDCTGHGVPGGFLSMLAITQLNEVLQLANISNAGEVLNLLRDRIKGILNQTSEESNQKDGMDMSLCIYYPERNELDFSGARNPACIVSHKGEVSVLKGDRQPIGIHLNEHPFTNRRITVAHGDMIYLFSDGLQDQFGGELGKKLKFSNLKALFSDIADKSCKSQKFRINTFLAEWTKPVPEKQYEQVDDIVVIGLRV